jgi:hypothetical protein
VPNALDAYRTASRIAFVGAATYGKPVGQRVDQLGSCDSMLFLVAFRLANAAGNSDYFQGLPDAASNAPLCGAADDLTEPQDSQLEASTWAAIYFAENGKCPTLPPAAARARAPAEAVDQLAGAARTAVQRDMPGTF